VSSSSSLATPAADLDTATCVDEPATLAQIMETIAHLSASCGLPQPGRPNRWSTLHDTDERTVTLFPASLESFDRWVSALGAVREPALGPSETLGQEAVHVAVAELSGWSVTLLYAQPTSAPAPAPAPAPDPGPAQGANPGRRPRRPGRVR
jgi:hypothetical protein